MINSIVLPRLNRGIKIEIKLLSPNTCESSVIQRYLLRINKHTRSLNPWSMYRSSYLDRYIWTVLLFQYLFHGKRYARGCAKKCGVLGLRRCSTQREDVDKFGNNASSENTRSKGRRTYRGQSEQRLENREKGEIIGRANSERGIETWKTEARAESVVEGIVGKEKRKRNGGRRRRVAERATKIGEPRETNSGKGLGKVRICILNKRRRRTLNRSN